MFPEWGPKTGPRIEGPYSYTAEGSSQVNEGPHRDHGHVIHNIQKIKSLFSEENLNSNIFIKKINKKCIEHIFGLE